jgi:alpha-tubulin suppressor-like RCC1 family protein
MQFRRYLIALQLLLIVAVPAPAAALPPAQAGLSGAAASSPARVISIWGGARHSIILKSDGSVWNWGMNWFGKLGDNTLSTFPPNPPGDAFANGSNDRHTPIQVHGPGNVGTLGAITAIMGGEAHNFALDNAGKVWAWGWNQMGQLGDGTNQDRYTPVKVKDPDKVNDFDKVIALGGRGYHSLAIRSDGSVWTWGFNDMGQLGDGTAANSNAPVQVIGLGSLKATAVSGGYEFSLALMSDHTLRAWGADGAGQLGDGTNNQSAAPVQVKGLNNVSQVSAGWVHTVAVRSTDGTVWTWGENSKGELGDGTTTNRNAPFQVGGLSGVTAVSAGDCSTAALKSDGTVWAWGCNDYGELGDGSAADRHTPVQVSGLSQVIAITARDYHNLAIESDGSVWAWGWNINGQLGDGTTTTRFAPVMIIPGQDSPVTPMPDALFLPLMLH